MIQFKNLKKVTLDFQDKIPSGKLKDCRICDVIEDHYEYLIWANRNGMLHYSKPVIAKLHQVAAYQENQEYFDNEVAPFMKEDYEESDYDIQIGDLDDVPF